MTRFDEMKAYVGFDDRHDGPLLRRLWPSVEPRLDEITDRFYAKVVSDRGAAAVLEDPATVVRLKATLQIWLKEMLQGPWDDAYWQRRRRIGTRHVEVGLPERYMHLAMSVMRDHLCHIAFEAVPMDRIRVTCSAVCKVTELDLAVMVAKYMQAHEHEQLTTLQDLLVSRLPVAVLLLDRTNKVTAATRPGRALFGVGDPVGRALTDVVPPPLVKAASLLGRIEHAVATGREMQLVRVDAEFDGQERSFRLAIVPLLHDLAEALVHIEEVTDVVRTEARLRRSETLAQLGALSAAVAHELRNPLAGISGAVQILARSLDETDPRKEVMLKVEEQIRRLNHLVSDLLAFARPDRVLLVDLDLREVSDRVVELVGVDHPEVPIEVRGRGRVRADANLTEHVLINLVQNGVQALEGAGRVRLVVSADEVRVEDDGPGVPEELRAQIFEPFFTTRTRGTGLGLAICAKAARAMGAQLTLAPAGEGLGGATFVMSFPT